MINPPYAFISYSRADASAADRIVQALESEGIRVWMDRTEIAPGENFAQSIEHALAGAQAFIYLASANSGRSNG